MYLIFTKELNGLISESSSRCNVATNKSLCDKNAGLNSFILKKINKKFNLIIKERKMSGGRLGSTS